MKKHTQNIAFFASGNGSNAQNIVEYFKDRPEFMPSLILTNKADAYVIQRAKSMNIPCITFSASELRNTNRILEILEKYDIDFIVLAGFLLRIPSNIIQAFPNKIINIHPALLPKFGGKGMYGDHVHKAVKEAQEKETGITIHYVNEHYDEGQIIFQEKVSVLPTDSPDNIAEKVHALEYEHFPKVIDRLLFLV
jgi:phosphoribosylglycinamide formyltransferase-1